MVTVNRCGRLPRGKRGANGEDHLLLEDFSTFCNNTLRKWEDRPRDFRNHRFCVLGDVYLRLNIDTAGDSDLPSVSGDQTQKLVYAMSEVDHLSQNDANFWESWKGLIATLLGVTAGVTKFQAGMKLTGAGFYCSHWLGIKLFGGYISTSATISAAAPAVGMALGVAAAVYFIPWDSLWAYFQRLVGNLWDSVCGIWDWIKAKLSSLLRVAEDLPPPYSMDFGNA